MYHNPLRPRGPIAAGERTMIGFEGESEWNALLWAVTAAIALVPTLIFFKAWHRIRTRNLLLTAVAFLMVFGKAVLLTAAFAWLDFSDTPWWMLVAGVEIAVIALITFALAHRE